MNTPNTHIHDRTLARLGINKSMKSGGVSCLGMPMPKREQYIYTNIHMI